ncbi:hypothetical protein HUC49_22550 [Escherichia coli]|nr:hypothetical protein [Escherichia coli]NUE52479.1 hypothetical protein [Escherichia coli]
MKGFSEQDEDSQDLQLEARVAGSRTLQLGQSDSVLFPYPGFQSGFVEVNDSSQGNQRKRAARTVLTGMCYSVGSATRQGSSSPTRFIGQSAMTSRT